MLNSLVLNNSFLWLKKKKVSFIINCRLLMNIKFIVCIFNLIACFEKEIYSSYNKLYSYRIICIIHHLI